LKHHTLAKLVAFSIGLAATFSATSAKASGFLVARFGADHGHPAVAAPFAIYFNPAAIRGAKGTQLAIDAAIAYRHLKYTRSTEGLSPTIDGATGQSTQAAFPGYAASNTGTNSINNILGIPFLGITSDLGTDFMSIGFATYVPFGGMAKWGKNDNFKGSITTPGGVDGPQRWHNISGMILSVYNTAALAFTIPNTGFSIGVNGSLVYHRVATIRARIGSGNDNTNNTDGTVAEGRSFVNTHGINFAAGIGLYYKPTEHLAFGLSYSGRPGFGETRLSGTLENRLPPSTVTAKQDIDLTHTLPDVIRLGASIGINKQTEVRFDAEYVTWSVFKQQCIVQRGASCKLDTKTGAYLEGDIVQGIVRDWHDGWGLRASVSRFLKEDQNTELFGSMGVDSSPVPITTLDPSLFDSFKLLGTIGVRQRLNKTVALAGSYNLVYFLPIDTKGQVISDQLSPSRTPSSDGKYSSDIHFININATFQF
jgi:long-chain fatty acid transport protein